MSSVMGEGQAQQTGPSSDPRLTNVDFQIQPLEKHGKELACAITGTAVNGGVIELSKGSAHKMTFQLVSGNVSGLSFVAASDDPFCSVVDDCPKKGDQITQFRNVTVTGGGQTLTVEADPGTDPIVHYALRFTDGSKQYVWDPIIINH